MPAHPAIVPADPCAMVLFGATGDLARRLVVPALYNLACSGVLPEHFALIGVARHGARLEDWRASLREGVTPSLGAATLDEAVWSGLSGRMSFVEGDLTDPSLYAALRTEIAGVSVAQQTAGNVIFHLAVEDRLFATVVDQLAEAGLTDQRRGVTAGWRRVVVEKPFGHSLESARDLNADLARRLGENQIFRIDHFLGKDTVQNIAAFRFANGLFESIWNRDRIDHVQIAAAETLGVEARGDFYERTGAMRDMAPNHLLSLVSLVAMEPPVGRDADSLRTRKADVLAAIPAVSPARAVRGQYDAGELGGRAVRPYREEPGVAPRSNVETYAALELRVENARWEGVPFFIRTGKRLSARVTEIAIRFKSGGAAPVQATTAYAAGANWLVLRIAPDESISVQFDVKGRGPDVDLVPAKMTFIYDNWFGERSSVGYETLLYDVMIGDPTLFMRADMVEHGWRIVQPVLDAWATETPAFPNYASGTAGPAGADRLIARDGDRRWRSVSVLAEPVSASDQATLPVRAIPPK